LESASRTMAGGRNRLIGQVIVDPPHCPGIMNAMETPRPAPETVDTQALGSSLESTPLKSTSQGRSHEWLGRLGDREPSPYAAMSVAERIEMVWPITLAAWAFSGEPHDESRLRRDVECLGRRER
jgi:hypothetical protein